MKRERGRGGDGYGCILRWRVGILVVSLNIGCRLETREPYYLSNLGKHPSAKLGN